MAASAKPANHIDYSTVDEYLDRFEELEDKALDIMMEAMKACKGPRGEQRSLRKEMKQAGTVVMRTREIARRTSEEFGQ